MAVKEQALLATDDKALREAAKNHSVKVIGSLGLLKLFYLQGIITKKKHYLSFLEKLQEDLYLTKELIDWAKKGI